MAGLFEFLRSMGASGINEYLANRARRNALNEAGLFMTDPGFAAPVADYNMFAPGEIDAVSDIIRRNGDPDFFNNVVRDKRGNVISRTPITSQDERVRRIQNAIGESSPFTQYTRDNINQAIEARRDAYNAANAGNRAARERYEMWNNGKRLAGTNMTWNSELAHQKANTFKRWFKGGGIIDPLLMAYTLYNADDKEQAFKDMISIPSILETAGTGATLGTLGALATGGGLGWGALSGASIAAPLASLAGGYWLGSKIDEATGASSNIANAAWNLMHNDEAERAESDRKAAANPEVVKAQKFLNIRKNLMDTYGLSKIQANEIADRVMAGTSMEQALQNAGIIIPGVDTTTPSAQNNTISKKANATPSGVSYLDAVSNTQTPSAIAQNETSPNSKLRVYDRDGNFLRYI